MFFHRCIAGITAILLVSMVAGCVTTGLVEKRPVIVENCKADGFRTLLWKPANVLDAMNLPNVTRIIYPDQAVTTDYRPERLNIKIGKLGRIEQVFCG